MSELTIIGIDNGNGNIKTKNETFPCGYHMQETEPNKLFSKDILEYNGKFYTLTTNAFPYQNDKTTDEKTYVLSLFGIAKELIARNPNIAKEGFVGKEVLLAVGLPPAHFEKQAKNFKQYFLNYSNHGVQFKYNGATFSFYIKDVLVFPQDFAGAVIFKNELLTMYSTSYCVDIGTGTTDLVGITNGMPDKDKMLSREIGMNKLRSMIIDDVINDYGVTLDDKTVEDFLADRPVALAPEFADKIKDRIAKTAMSFTTDLVNQLHSKVPDFRVFPTIFLGGGSIALKSYIEATKAFGIVEFIPDINANAVGYETMAKMKFQAK